MTDPFRENYIDITEGQAGLIKAIKEKAKELYDLYRAISIDKNGVGRDFGIPDKIVDNRAISIAKTELETSVMWAVKGFTKTE